MAPSPRSPALHFLALAGLAAAAALIANTLASPARHLAWRRSAAAPLAFPSPTERPGPQAGAASGQSVLAPPGRPALRPGPSRPAARAEEVAASSPIREISSGEAWEAFKSGVPFLDARRRAEFAEGHVAGAWCAPVWESDLDERLISFKAARRPGPEDAIVIYCSGGECRDSHLLASRLVQEGYYHLLIYRDGFPDWVKQGRPLERGARP